MLIDVILQLKPFRHLVKKLFIQFKSPYTMYTIDVAPKLNWNLILYQNSYTLFSRSHENVITL